MNRSRSPNRKKKKMRAGSEEASIHNQAEDEDHSGDRTWKEQE